VGTPPQTVRTLVSTANNQPLVVADQGCLSCDPADCVDKRGGIFHTNTSSTWYVKEFENFESLWFASLLAQRYDRKVVSSEFTELVRLIYYIQDSEQHHIQWDPGGSHRNELGVVSECSIWQRCCCSRRCCEQTTNNLGSAFWSNNVKGLLFGPIWNQCLSY